MRYALPRRDRMRSTPRRGAAGEVVAPASVAPNESDASRAIELQYDRADLLLSQG